MARNGAGTYVLPAGQPVVTGTTISSSTHNTLMTDIANALTTSVASDGQTAMSANLPMGGFKLTGLAAGSAATDSARYDQVTPKANIDDPVFTTKTTSPKYITSVASNNLATATWGNLIVFVSAAPGTWLVSFNIGATGDTANYGTTVIVMTDTGAATMAYLLHGTLLDVQLVGLQLQARQSSGLTQTINATATRIG